MSSKYNLGPLATHNVEQNMSLLGQSLDESGVLNRADNNLDTESFQLLRLLLRADESGDVVLRVLGDGLEDRGTDETCVLISTVIVAPESYVHVPVAPAMRTVAGMLVSEMGGESC